MALEVLLRKLAYLRQLLTDLAQFEKATLGEVRTNHYQIERLLEQLATAASDILFNLRVDASQLVPSYSVPQ